MTKPEKPVRERDARASEAAALGAKRLDAWWTVLVVDPVALRILPFLARLSVVTPMRLTLVGAALSAASVVAFAGEHFVVGALLFQAGFFFDCLDGKLARIRAETSPFGAFIDRLLDLVFRIAAFVVLALHVFPDSRIAPVLVVTIVLLESWLRIYPARRPTTDEPWTPGVVARAKAAMAERRLVLLPSTVEFETLSLFLAPLTGRLDVIRIALVIALAGYVFYSFVHVRRFLRPFEVRERANAEADPLAVVILAAGRGSRLGTSADDVPKWFLRVGARTIADWQLEGLRRSADLWSRVLVVTGHGREMFDASALSSRLGARCELVHNEMYASRNNWLSLQLGLSRLLADGWEGSVCVLNSDLLLAPEALRRFLDTASREPASILAVDFDVPRSDEQMKIAIDPETDLVVDIGKNALTAPPAGEYVGLSKIDARHVRRLAEILESFLHDPRRSSEWYEGAFRDAMRAGVEFSAFRVDSGRWIEVDDGDDLDRAPAIASLFGEES